MEAVVDVLASAVVVQAMERAVALLPEKGIPVVIGIVSSADLESFMLRCGA